MIDKKEMLMKVASYDKTARVLANVVLAYKDMMAKKAAKETTDKQAAVKKIVDGILVKCINK